MEVDNIVKEIDDWYKKRRKAFFDACKTCCICGKSTEGTALITEEGKGPFCKRCYIKRG